MDEKSKKIFEQREAVQYLVEDCELACIEFEMKLRAFQRFYSFPEKYGGIQSNAKPSLVIAYMNEELYKKHLVELEYVREKTNLNYLRRKAKELWLK